MFLGPQEGRGNPEPMSFKSRNVLKVNKVSKAGTSKRRLNLGKKSNRKDHGGRRERAREVAPTTNRMNYGSIRDGKCAFDASSRKFPKT